MGDPIAVLLCEQVERNHEAIETMCERMLTQDGTDYGVLVQANPDATVTVTLSPDVPFGQVHYLYQTGAF